jgi:glycolate oxidase iron-sulfur subunit
VHCGFCLQACPTYLALDDENDSPRGRIVLMKALAEGALPPADPVAARHLDRCLACRGCESACPSGVPYGRLLETTRERLARTRGLPLAARALLAVFARPRLLAAAMWAGRLLRATRGSALLARLPGRVGFAMAMLESTRRGPRRTGGGSAAPPARGTVALLTGCVMEGLFSEVNRATERVLAANGYRPVAAPGQRCCGALHVHAGDGGAARALARANVAAFEASGADFVAVNSAGCGSTMKEYAYLLHDDPAWHERARVLAARVRDVSELLVEAGPVRGMPLAVRVAYDAPCHLLHAQRVSAAPLAVLAAIPGIGSEPLPDADQCCGGAGIFSLLQPEVAERVLGAKLASIAASGAEMIATGNPGCLMQIGAGLRRAGSATRARHPVELLDESYATMGPG